MEAIGDCDPSAEPSGGRGRHCWRRGERKGTDMDRGVKKDSRTVSQRTEESSSVVRLGHAAGDTSLSKGICLWRGLSCEAEGPVGSRNGNPQGWHCLHLTEEAAA